MLCKKGSGALDKSEVKLSPPRGAPPEELYEVWDFENETCGGFLVANFQSVFPGKIQGKTPWVDSACADCPGFWVLAPWVLLLPRLPPSSRSLGLFPGLAFCFMGPWTFAWICCPQFPYYPCKKTGRTAHVFTAQGGTRRKIALNFVTKNFTTFFAARKICHLKLTLGASSPNLINSHGGRLYVILLRILRKISSPESQICSSVGPSSRHIKWHFRNLFRDRSRKKRSTHKKTICTYIHIYCRVNNLATISQ